MIQKKTLTSQIEGGSSIVKDASIVGSEKKSVRISRHSEEEKTHTTENQ